MKVQVEIDNFPGNEWEMAETITALAAENLLKQTGLKEDSRLLKERVASITDDEIRGRVVPLIEQSFTRALQPTDGFGHPLGEPVTLDEYITKIATDFLKAETGDYNRRETVVKKFIREEVQRQVQGALKAALTAAQAEVTAAVQQEAAAVVASTIMKMAGKING